MAPSWLYLPLWLWCVCTPQLNWIVEPAFCFIVPRCLFSIGPCQGIYVTLWHFLAASMQESLVPCQGICITLWHFLAASMQVSLVPWTFFFCGLIPSWDNTYPRYSVSVAQNDYLRALTFSCASRSLIKSLFSLLIWSSRLPLVMHNKSSI
jgi:hypothetical protein